MVGSEFLLLVGGRFLQALLAVGGEKGGWRSWDLTGFARGVDWLGRSKRGSRRSGNALEGTKGLGVSLIA